MNTAATVITPSNNILPLIARILLGAIFLISGVRKVMGFAATAAYLTKLGFPAPEVMAVIAMIIEVGGSILLIIGWKTRWVAWLLALFVLIAAFAAHRFWEFDAAQATNQMNHFLKNLAIVGGLLMVACFGPGRTSVDRI
jgi:putative oxidoreductase